MVKKKGWTPYIEFVEGKKYEIKYQNKLKHSGFEILFGHKRKGRKKKTGFGKFQTPYDIVAKNKKNGDIYLIDVKKAEAEKNPSFSIKKNELKRMLEAKPIECDKCHKVNPENSKKCFHCKRSINKSKKIKVDVLGYAFCINNIFYLFTVRKQSIAAGKAWRGVRASRKIWSRKHRIHAHSK